MTNEILVGVAAAAGGWVVKDMLTPLIRRRLERADDAERETMAAVLERINESQGALADRIKEDREQASRHFDTLYQSARTLDRRMVRLEVHHEGNHPGQRVGDA